MQSIRVAIYQAEVCGEAGDVVGMKAFLNEAHRQMQSIPDDFAAVEALD